MGLSNSADGTEGGLGAILTGVDGEVTVDCLRKIVGS